MAQFIGMSLAPEQISKPVLREHTPAPDIAGLTAGLVKGDDRAYQDFFAAYARRLLLYNLALCNGDEEAARELLQQAMIRVAKHARIFENESAFWSWLTVIARSCWIDEHRKRKRYTTFLDFFRRHQPEAIELSDPAEVFSDLLDTLSPGERELLEDKYVAGHSVRELAAARDTTEKAIESKLSRLREKLRSLNQP